MSFWHGLTHIFGHPFGLGEKDSEDPAKVAAQQMQEYQKQRAVMQKQLQMQRQQMLQEQKRLDEKQVRSLRHSYSAGGGFYSDLEDVGDDGATKQVTGG